MASLSVAPPVNVTEAEAANVEERHRNASATKSRFRDPMAWAYVCIYEDFPDVFIADQLIYKYTNYICYSKSAICSVDLFSRFFVFLNIDV